MYLNMFHARNTDYQTLRLTVTWDVFEFLLAFNNRKRKAGLTVTWDVFEYNFSLSLLSIIDV